MFSCMDSRVVVSQYTKSDLGDNYIIKNAGNFVPYPEDLEKQANITSAAGALELTCVRNNIKHVVVAGHSDCKVTVCPENKRTCNSLCIFTSTYQ